MDCLPPRNKSLRPLLAIRVCLPFSQSGSRGPALEDARRLVPDGLAAVGGAQARHGLHGDAVAGLEGGARGDAAGHHGVTPPGRRLHEGVPAPPVASGRGLARHEPLQHDGLRRAGARGVGLREEERKAKGEGGREGGRREGGRE